MFIEDIFDCTILFQIIERALIAVGLCVDGATLIWDAYVVLEMAFLSATTDADEIEKQKARIDKIYRRQLAIPLQGMENTWNEYLEFLGGMISSELDEMCNFV